MQYHQIATKSYSTSALPPQVRDSSGKVIFAPSFSIWTTIEECLNPPLIWEEGKGWFTTEPFSELEVRPVAPVQQHPSPPSLTSPPPPHLLPPHLLPPHHQVFEFPDGIGNVISQSIWNRLSQLHCSTPTHQSNITPLHTLAPTPASNRSRCIRSSV